MIINNPIIVKTDAEYEIKAQGPSIEALLRIFPNLRLRDDKYLYFEDEGYSPDTAINVSLFTFKTDRWSIMDISLPCYSVPKDNLIKLNVFPIHPMIRDRFSTELKYPYYNPVQISVTFEEASEIFNNPEAFLNEFVPKHLDLFSSYLDIMIKSIITYKDMQKKQKTFPQYPMWNVPRNAWGEPMSVPRYENAEFQPKVTPTTMEKMKGAFTSFLDKLPTPTQATQAPANNSVEAVQNQLSDNLYEQLSDIFGDSQKSENS